jgi:hypothetical protein
VDTIFGFIGLIVFCAAVIGLAAGVTWAVVKIDAIFRRARQKPTPAPGTES